MQLYRRLKGQIAEWDLEAEVLREKLDISSGNSYDKYQEQLDKIEEKIADAEAHLQPLQKQCKKIKFLKLK